MFITVHHLLSPFSSPFSGVKSLYDYGLWSTVVHELKIQPLLHMYDAQQMVYVCAYCTSYNIQACTIPPPWLLRRSNLKRTLCLIFFCISYDFLYSICSAPQKGAQKTHFKYEGILLCLKGLSHEMDFNNVDEN
jgi:hypothetical protein